MGNVYRDTECFSKEIEFIKCPISELLKQQSVEKYDDLVLDTNHTKNIYRTLEYSESL